MSHKDAEYFKKSGNGIVVNTYKCELYVPQAYFDSKLAMQDGVLYDIFFVLKYKLFHTEKAVGSNIPFGDFKHPVIMSSKPDETRNEELDLYGVKEKFVVFTYYRGSEIIHNRYIVKSSKALERYINLLNDGKIRLPYSSINDVTNKAQKIHDVMLNVPQYIQQLVISEIYRNKKDYSQPARLIATNTKSDDTNIRALNMRENSAFTSTLAGVSFEDVKSMLVVADNRDDEKTKEFTPIEKVIRGIR